MVAVHAQVFIDEAQDLNACQMAMFVHSQKQSMRVLIGDPHQVPRPRPFTIVLNLPRYATPLLHLPPLLALAAVGAVHAVSSD